MKVFKKKWSKFVKGKKSKFGPRGPYKKKEGTVKPEKIWEETSTNKQDEAIKQYKTKLKTNKVMEEYQTKLDNVANNITTKLATSKKPIRTTERKFLDTYQKFFVREENRFKPVNSSWLVSASYQKSTKIMRVNMIRGKTTYSFFEVPEWVWVHLTTVPNNAGKYWWDSWLWKYSANAHKWNRI